MIKNIKLANHKGVKEVRLTNLQQVNVLCGKNNAGKTSIAEAFLDKNKRSLGKQITTIDVELLCDIFSAQAAGYSSPHPNQSLQWFRGEVRSLTGAVLYEDQIDSLSQSMQAHYQRDNNRGRETFNFSQTFKQFLNSEPLDFQVMLISPKRDLLPKVSISTLGSAGLPVSVEVLHKLFRLSTQNDKSKDQVLYESIKNAFRDVTGGFKFHISLNAGSEIGIQFSNESGAWVNADDSGLGLRDVLIILAYLFDSSFFVLFIEEPENHIHPEIQRKLLKCISEQKNKQIFITTHSNVFLDPTYVNKIIYVESKNGETVISDETDKTILLEALGYSAIDNFVSDIIVLTEGPYDIPVIKEICRKIGFIHKGNIKFYPVGGDIMHHVDLSVFVEKSKVFAVVDSDPKSASVREKFSEKCQSNNISLCKLQRYSIENYFSIEAIKKIYPNPIPEDLIRIDPKSRVEDQLGFSVKKLGWQIVREMELSEFEGTDLLLFCDEIGKALDLIKKK